MLRNSQSANVNGWSVWVNGQQYTQYESFRFERNIKNQCGSYTLVTSNTMPRDYPIQVNDEIQIRYRDQVVFTGWSDRLKTGDGSGNTIELTGRDKSVCDLIDSSVPDSVKNIKGAISLRKLCESCISALGLNLKVIDQTKDKLADKAQKQQQTAKSGQDIGSFLAKFAAKNQLYLFADADGNLLVYKTEDTAPKNTKKLVYDPPDNPANNLLSASMEIDMSDVFAKVQVRGQGAVGYEASANKTSKSTNIADSAFDYDARPSRYLEISLSEPTSKDNARQRAIDEVNLRNARAQKYRCSMPYFWDDSGKPFAIGEIFNINDVMHQCQGDYLLAGFSVEFDCQSGTRVELEFAPPAAYAVVEFDDKTDKEKRRKKRYVRRQNDKEKAKTRTIK